MNLCFDKIARNLNIATSTANIIYHKFKDTGNVEVVPPGTRESSRKLDECGEVYVVVWLWKNHHCI